MQPNPKNQLKSFNKQIKFAGLVITIFAMLTGNCIGQSITWTKTYSGPLNYSEEAHSLCQSTDGNFFALGLSLDSVLFNNQILILKLNPYGDTLWAKIIPNTIRKSVTASISTSDGGCVFTGNGDTSFCMKIDLNGNLIWRKNYSVNSFHILDIKRMDDGGYLMCGDKLSGDRHGYIIKTDSIGNLQWQKFYNSTEYKSFSSIEIFDGTNCLLAGTVTDQPIDTQQVTVTKINNMGEVIWDKRYTIFGNSGNGKKIIRCNNSFIISGTTTDTTSTIGEVYYFLIDSLGSVLYTKRFSSLRNEALNDMKVLNPNKFVFAMTRDSNSTIRNSRVFISDSSGNILHDKIFRTPYVAGYIWLESILPQINGDFIFGGFSELTNNDSTDVFLTRTDSSLNVPPIGIINYGNLVPDGYTLYPPYPNPFNPATNIKYEIPKDASVSIKIYDLLGREVFSMNDFKRAGSYEVQFDGTNFASGMYFYKLVVGDASLNTNNGVLFTDTKKMVLVK